MKKLLTMLLTAGLLVACGNKNNPGNNPDSTGTQTADTTQSLLADSLDTQVADQPDKTFGNPKKDPFTATLHADGSVTINAQKAVIAKYTAQHGIKSKFKRDKAKVKGLTERCIDIIVSPIGLDEECFLIMLTDKGHVAILGLEKVLNLDDVTCSGPIPGINGIKKITMVDTEDGTMVLATDKKGKSQYIDTTLYCTKMENNGFTISLFPDHTIRIDYPRKNWHAHGAYIIGERDSDEETDYTQVIAKIKGHTYKISITSKLNGNDYNEVAIDTKDPSFKFDEFRDIVEMDPISIY